MWIYLSNSESVQSNKEALSLENGLYDGGKYKMVTAMSATVTSP